MTARLSYETLAAVCGIGFTIEAGRRRLILADVLRGRSARLRAPPISILQLWECTMNYPPLGALVGIFVAVAAALYVALRRKPK